MRKIFQVLWFIGRFMAWFSLSATITGIVILYPPISGTRDFVHTISRISSTELDVEAVREIAQTLPDDPKKIEHAVRYNIIRYERSWTTYGYPWYYPTVAEAVANGAGDCKSQAMVFMSILLAKDIDITKFKILYTTTHMWVHYPDKTYMEYEQPSAAVGSYTVHMSHPVSPFKKTSAIGGEGHAESLQGLITPGESPQESRQQKITIRSNWQLPSTIEFRPGEKWQMVGYHFWEPAPEGKKAQLLVSWYLSVLVALLSIPSVWRFVFRGSR